MSDDFNTNPKKFWSFIKTKHQESTCVSPLKNQNSILKSGSAGNGETLNTQFKSVFTEEDLSNLPHKGKSPYSNMGNKEVGKKGVFKLLQNLQVIKTTGPDSIPAFILKTGTKELAPVLTSIFK